MGGDEDITWKHHALPALLIAYIVRSVLKTLQLKKSSENKDSCVDLRSYAMRSKGSLFGSSFKS
jgi:hypothetical protein